MRNKKLLIVSTIIIMSLAIVEIALGSCSDLWSNCTSTAIDNYDNGSYDFETFIMFYNEICPQAYDTCVN